MKLDIDSSKTAVSLDLTSGETSYCRWVSSGVQPSSVINRKLSISMLSNERSVTIVLKPSVVAQEERQERLNQSIRQGFTPISRDTRG